MVVLSSILARIAVPAYTGYSASKAGLLGLVRSFAAEFAPRGVQVNAICPGWVDTDMAWQGLDAAAEADGGTREEAYRDAMKLVPLGRMSQPEDIAGTVAWFLSPDARGVTGQAIDQNGGAGRVVGVWHPEGADPGALPTRGTCCPATPGSGTCGARPHRVGGASSPAYPIHAWLFQYAWRRFRRSTSKCSSSGCTRPRVA